MGLVSMDDLENVTGPSVPPGTDGVYLQKAILIDRIQVTLSYLSESSEPSGKRRSVAGFPPSSFFFLASSFLMLSIVGRSSGIVPPRSLIVSRTFLPTLK
jgi:hypothetical protein